MNRLSCTPWPCFSSWETGFTVCYLRLCSLGTHPVPSPGRWSPGAPTSPHCRLPSLSCSAVERSVMCSFLSPAARPAVGAPNMKMGSLCAGSLGAGLKSHQASMTQEPLATTRRTKDQAKDLSVLYTLIRGVDAWESPTAPSGKIFWGWRVFGQAGYLLKVQPPQCVHGLFCFCLQDLGRELP